MVKEIVIVTWFYPDQPGYLDFAHRINSLAANYSVTVISRASVAQVKEFSVEKFKEIVVSTSDCHKPRHVMYMFRVAKLLRRLRPDLVVHLGSHTAATVLLTPGIRSIVYWNEHPSHYFSTGSCSPLKRLLSNFVLSLTYRGAKASRLIMPNGEPHLADLLEHNVESNKCCLLYMGVSEQFDIRRVHDAGQSSEHTSLRLVYTGTVIKERGRDVMLEGLALARRAAVPVTLMMVGASPEQIEYCSRRAEELGLDDALTVIGRVSGHSIPDYLCGADAGICIWEDRTYWRFNLPTKLFEYLVAGLPVLASRIRTHSDCITDWENGVLFDYSAEALAEAIAQLWQRRGELPRLSRQAAESGRKYLWKNIEPRFLRAIADCIGE